MAILPRPAFVILGNQTNPRRLDFPHAVATRRVLDVDSLPRLFAKHRTEAVDVVDLFRGMRSLKRPTLDPLSCFDKQLQRCDMTEVRKLPSEERRENWENRLNECKPPEEQSPTA